MRTVLIGLLVAVLVLGACGRWFGRNRAAPAPEVAGDVNPLIPPVRAGFLGRPESVDNSVPIFKVSELRIDRTTTGAIILATGVAARQGAYAAQLRADPSEENLEKGVLSLTFRVVYPDFATAQGAENTRTVHGAVTVNNADLEGINLIRVVAQENAREVRRR